ncbi:hypothetical protein A9239_03800 [Methanosarcina sp. A14]|uniref:Uncharacterized protein n=1 Tax=Methanosarcina barkeri 227 TaxID=1434106 RepID=A0A0E3LPJ8_METBA|nr:hypothetical protein MSBR2_0130 [Methanosarcina barkeri 227]OEC91026.1 hypothetical protein A9239_03800 [Methanosarcina sp. A14]
MQVVWQFNFRAKYVKNKVSEAFKSKKGIAILPIVFVGQPLNARVFSGVFVTLRALDVIKLINPYRN